MQGLYELVTVCREQKTKRVTEGKFWEDRFLREFQNHFHLMKSKVIRRFGTVSQETCRLWVQEEIPDYE